MNIGRRIAFLRKKKGFSQADLASYLNISPQSVSRWERHNGSPDIILLPQISQFLGVSIDTLFGVEDIRNVEALIEKYTVLKNDTSFQNALSVIDCAIEHAEIEQHDEKLRKLFSYKMHILIQRHREILEAAMEIAVRLLPLTENPESPLHHAVRMQEVQLDISLGNAVEVVKRTKANFHSSPSGMSLQLYLNALNETFQDKAVQDLFDDPNVSIILSHFKQKADEDPSAKIQLCNIWEFFFYSAYRTEKLSFFQRHLKEFQSFAPPEHLFGITMKLAQLLEILGMETEKERCVADLEDILERIDKRKTTFRSLLEKIKTRESIEHEKNTNGK